MDKYRHDNEENCVEKKEKKPMSAALSHAMNQVKEGMTDSQKSYTLQKEGKNLMERSDYLGAIEVFSHAIDANHTVSLFHNRASCYKILKEWTNAYYDYCFAIRLEPDVSTHYALRGQIMMKMYKMDLALEDFTTACNLGGESAGNNFFLRGSYNNEIEDYENALKDLDTALQLVEGSSSSLPHKILIKRALVQFNIKNYSKSIEDLGRVLNLDPNNLAARTLLSRALRENAQLKKALENIEYVILMDPKNPTYLIERADVKYYTGDQQKIADAIADYSKAIIILNETKYKQTGTSSGFMMKNNSNSGGNKLKPRSISMAQVPNAIPASSTPTSPKKRGVVSTFDEKEWALQASDAHYKKAQALLSLNHERVYNAQKALSSIGSCIHLFPKNETYKLLRTVCLIRLNKPDDARTTIGEILEINPKNERALFHQAYCKRVEGENKDAIRDLSYILKILEGNDDLEMTGDQEKEEAIKELGRKKVKSALAGIPIFRVYELRGMLLHELQAYAPALIDLGRALALNPANPMNYFLRADCHSKLGNYELALSDFIMAETHQFSPLEVLYTERGLVLRMIGDSKRASDDFVRALEFMRKKEELMSQAQTEGDSVTEEGSTADAKEEEEEDDDDDDDDDDKLSTEKSKFSRMGTDYYNMVRIMSLQALSLIDSKKHRRAYHVLQEAIGILRHVEEDLEELFELPESEGQGDVELIYQAHMRLQWTVIYHLAQCLYSQRQFEGACEKLRLCYEDFRVHAPDSNALGSVFFYTGVSMQNLKRFVGAETMFDECSRSLWCVDENNRALTLFARGKARQGQGDHVAAIADFTTAIDLRDKDPYIYFRRAWSKKATGDYISAASDFEYAKQLAPNDPNFAIEYRKIHSIDYVWLDRESDFVHPFPSLLPPPKAQPLSGREDNRQEQESEFFRFDMEKTLKKAKDPRKFSPIRSKGKNWAPKVVKK